MHAPEAGHDQRARCKAGSQRVQPLVAAALCQRVDVLRWPVGAQRFARASLFEYNAPALLLGIAQESEGP